MTAWLLCYALNALVQVPLLFVGGWLAAHLIRPAGPLAEHRVWVSAAGLQVVLPAYSGSPRSLLGLLWTRSTNPAGPEHLSAYSGPVTIHPGLHLAPSLAHVLLTLYLLSVLYAAARLMRAFHLARLMRDALPPVLSPALQDIWHACLQSFRLSGVALAESAGTRSPVTLGLRHPLILLPAGLLARISPDEFGTVLLHEFAHIRRHDFAWNLALQVLTLPVAFHPFTHITRARLSQTREIVCDALAAEASAAPPLDGRIVYARSLLRLASTLAQGSVLPNHLGIGIFDDQTLERRFMNLTQLTPRPTPTRRLLLLAAAVTLGLATTASAVALHTRVSADPVKVASDVMAGQVQSKVTPKYPKAAKEAHIQGTVLLHAVIGKDGTISNLTIVSGPPELTSSAFDAVRQWTYEPYRFNGEPTEVETTITVNYSLQK